MLKNTIAKPLRVPQESRENVSDYRDRPLSLSEYEQGIKELEDEIQKVRK
ncbi:MAG: hypothetical protein HWD59_03610 [Coxiellaceae bacterium]|nr:MAG: hypothetical protein HWD59_03610 [Coxiellaceae bacterium]